MAFSVFFIILAVSGNDWRTVLLNSAQEYDNVLEGYRRYDFPIRNENKNNPNQNLIYRGPDIFINGSFNNYGMFHAYFPDNTGMSFLSIYLSNLYSAFPQIWHWNRSTLQY